MFLAAVAAACAIAVAPSSDYTYLTLRGVDAPWQVLRNGQPWKQGDPIQVFLASSVETPKTFPRAGALPLDEGTLEFRLAPVEDGGSALYQQNRTLVSYKAANGDTFTITQAGSTGIVYFGGTVKGQWESAYGSRGLMRSWKAGEFHHVAATWSVSANQMRFYLDGALVASTNENHYWAPEATGATFAIDPTGYTLRDAVIGSRSIDVDEIRAHATRIDRPQAGEVWVPVSGLAEGDRVTATSGGCSAGALEWTGVPIRNPRPASTLLSPGTTAIDLVVDTPTPASCRYAVNASPPLASMTPLTGRVVGLSGDPRQADEVFVRCSNAPDYALRLLYRSLPVPNPRFPRKSNLWGSGNMLAHGYDFAAKVDVYLGAELSPADIRALRQRNPNILVLTSINTVENRGLPEDYYLHDTLGRKIEVWPGTYRLNLTKPYVAQYQARWAYQKMLDSDLLYDGCFFDNFFTSQSWLKADIHGNAVQLDADEDGKPDDPVWLDATWRQGVFSELQAWRALMPVAYASGHLSNPITPEVAPIFNGNSVLFWATNVMDGKTPFVDFWQVYQGWSETARAPQLTTIESSPQNQIAYGYGYDLLRTMPAATQLFARDYFPSLRFGLATALMRDGSFHRDYGDIVHGTDWWYDEYDFDLGYPTGPPERVSAPAITQNLVINGGFEQDLSGSWTLAVDSRDPGPAQARAARDPEAHEGGSSVRIDVTVPSLDWHVELSQRNRAFVKGQSYDLTFWAKASAPRSLGLSAQEQVAPWTNFGLSQKVSLETTWKAYTVTFEANATVDDSRLQFFVGDATGSVWIDQVELRASAPQVWRRTFTNGAVLLNGTRQPATVAMPGYERFRGAQAPRHQYVIDDEDAGFVAASPWRSATFDSGQWKSAGPFYHHWGSLCHVLDAGASGFAQWDLQIPADGEYTIEAWWAAAPEQASWARQATYEVVAAGAIVATGTLDQTQAGDQWHKVATTRLRAADHPVLRVRNAGSGRLVADALHVWSTDRFNDGSAADTVVVAPLDGILLRKR